MADEELGTVRLIIGGDVMLGRLVGEHIQLFGPDYPLGDLGPLMQRGDLVLVNLECAITSHPERWPGAEKAFYFQAPPVAVESLRSTGVDLVSLANNHALDHGVPGLLETLRLLDEQGIGHAGAGRNLAEARRPAIVERNGLRFGLVAYCDHQADFAAGPKTPGIAYLDMRDRGRALATVRDGLDQMKKLDVDWPILSLHAGPNMVERPSDAFVSFAHAAVQAGARILWGHSAHCFHGVESIGGRPILYSTGDLVDDYMVDAYLRNDLGLLFEFHVDAARVREAHLHPIRIERCKAAPAQGPDLDFILERARRLCRPFGTRVERTDGRIALIT